MAALTTVLLSLVLISTTLDAMDTLPPIPATPTFRNPSSSAPIARDLQAAKKTKGILKRTKQPYAFGQTAAKTLEEAIELGFFKNEHPFRPGTPLINSFQVGHCVIVQRSDERFTYGVITEVLNPSMVCVACDGPNQNQEGYTIKIMAANHLYLKPEWLVLAQKDKKVVAHYTHNINGQSLPETLVEEESYQLLPKHEHVAIKN